jgi:hypothetical protein
MCSYNPGLNVKFLPLIFAVFGLSLTLEYFNVANVTLIKLSVSSVATCSGTKIKLKRRK